MWSAQPHSGSAAPSAAPGVGSLAAPGDTTGSPADRSASYLPGYLSRIKETRPYSSPLHAAPARPPPAPADETGNESTSLLAPHRHSIANASSPQHAFSSSFFQPRQSGRYNDSFNSTSEFGVPSSRSLVAGGSLRAARATAPAQTRPHSIFGPSGLRARAGPDPTGMIPSASFSFSVHDPSGSVIDDDEAPPPVQSLDEEEVMDNSGATAPGTASTWLPSASTSTSFASRSAHSSVLDTAPAPAPRSVAPPAQQESKVRTVILFGFPRALERLVLEHFSGNLVSSEWVSLSHAADGPGYVQAVYADASAAFRALRRSGELVAGVAMVGVRAQDDEVNRTLLVDGLATASTSALGEGGAGSSHAASTAAPQGRPRPRASMGRPLSVIGTKDSALAPPSADTSSSFFRLPGWSSPATQTQDLPGTQRSSSVLGRFNDAVFGW